jgi:hypothetical protein
MKLINTRVFHSALVLIFLLMSACGGGGGASSSTTPATTAASDALFTDSANPVNVTVVTDGSRAVSQTVGSTGGTLGTTAADGSQFTLTIPADALTEDTVISMTPIISASGVPLTGGLVAGVQFAPDGLFLKKDATLTIVPAVSVPVGNQTFLGYSGAGNDLHLVPPASPTAEIKMLIGHFSGNMLGNGIAADRAALLLKRAASHEARLEQEMARYLSEARQKALLGTSDENPDFTALTSIIESYYGLVVYPRVLAASSSCENATLALKTLLGYERFRQILGAGSRPGFLTDMDTVSQALSSTCAFTTSTVVAGDLTVSSQTICRLNQPFTLAMSGQYSATFNFTPTDKTRGAVTYSGTANTVPAYGAGTYDVSWLDTTSAVLTLHTNDCVTLPAPVGNICNANTLPIPLKRLDHGC